MQFFLFFLFIHIQVHIVLSTKFVFNQKFKKFNVSKFYWQAQGHLLYGIFFEVKLVQNVISNPLVDTRNVQWPNYGRTLLVEISSLNILVQLLLFDLEEVQHSIAAPYMQQNVMHLDIWYCIFLTRHPPPPYTLCQQ